MPSRSIEYDEVTESIPFGDLVEGGPVISTSSGLMILEIQGDLNLPQRIPDKLTETESEMYVQDESSLGINTADELGSSGSHTAVKFGKLDIDGKRATLYIGSSQRLVGTIEKIDPPLGLMRILSESSTEETPIQVLDVIRQKAIFRSRPLPIM
ncbi:unnamed protein product [Kuraishia capsulata CBS 1993]|uniref:Chromosome transmission fidelity protein 8 n=1 Tax=Kuraishia capsulata CBS 1993 TaxID=1382522 RepID=W6MU83_9ASCO|nr:uncharacterized protein KUCA_T00004948001 [Kuraishia capsulata CBS 1993]CDK28962.1 unnamed protein product [Kuraishia capsulata CBS 1993]